ncbi:MAG: hypothetical protein LBG72_02370 [Spirochaetaceae bacterium]|jgi:hypothetical protein|nr:hypothetical protein [Spirochaetaceae bacterium]
MKKIFTTLTLFFILSAAIFAQAEDTGAETGEAPKENGFTRAMSATGNAFKTAGLAVAGYFNNPDGTTEHLEAYNPFSLSILPSRFGIGLSTDLPIGITDILGKGDNKWKKNGKLILDFDKIYDTGAIKSNGLDFNFEFFIKNFIGFTFRFKDSNSAAGLSIGNVSARLDMNLSEDLFEFLAEGIAEGNHKYGLAISGAVFAEFLSFNYNHKGFYGKVPKLFFSATGTWFAPLIYIPRSDINVVLNSTDQVDMYLNGTAEMYSFINPNGGAMDLGGFDVSLQVEYALFAIMDVGISALHIPLIPAVLHSGKELKWDNIRLMEIPNLTDIQGGIEFDTSKIMDSQDFSSGFDKTEYVVLRPMRWDFYALFRPLRRDILTLRPNIGFTVITPSKDPYFNIGLEVQFNAGKMFTASFFTGGYDGLCRNRLGIDFHVGKAARFVMGLEMRSQSYGGAWSLKGAAVEIGWNWGGGYRGVTNF